MSQVTLLGICSDNVVTILQPSSTINCVTCGCDAYSVSATQAPTPYTTPVKIDISGSVFISGTVVTAGNTVTVSIGGASFSGSTSVPFQVFATGSSVILTITGASTSYSYTIARYSA